MDDVTALRDKAEAAWRRDWGASVPGQGRYSLGHEPHKATFIRGYEAAAAEARAPHPFTPEARPITKEET